MASSRSNRRPCKKSKWLMQHHTEVSATAQPLRSLQLHQALHSTELQVHLPPERVTIPQRFRCANESLLVGERQSFPTACPFSN